MGYRQEINRMKKHRERFYPELVRLSGLYAGRARQSFPLPLTDPEEMLVVLELLTLGYLDQDSFLVVKKSGAVSSLSYNGRPPLTAAGESVLREFQVSRIKKAIIAFLAAALLFTVATVLFLIFG